MKWTTATKWGLLAWLVTMSAVGALMFYTDFAAQVGRAAALKRYGLLALLAFPLIIWLIKKSGDDLSAFRAAWPPKNKSTGSS
jgi:hypothetical protein